MLLVLIDYRQAGISISYCLLYLLRVYSCAQSNEIRSDQILEVGLKHNIKWQSCGFKTWDEYYQIVYITEALLAQTGFNWNDGYFKHSGVLRWRLPAGQDCWRSHYCCVTDDRHTSHYPNWNKLKIEERFVIALANVDKFCFVHRDRHCQSYIMQLKYG